jgi:hypothetical protein
LSSAAFDAKIALSHVTLDEASHSCVIIFPDQSFHLEKSAKSTPTSPGKIIFVAEGMLTRDEQIQVASIIGDPNLEKMNPPSRRSMAFKQSIDVVYASIPRSSTHVQDLSIISVDHEPLDVSASALIKLMEAITSRKPAESRNAPRNSCKEPVSARPLKK